MALFEGFRDKGWNTYYDEFRIEASYDVKFIALVYLSVLMALAFAVLILGSRKQEARSCIVRCIFFRIWSDVII